MGTEIPLLDTRILVVMNISIYTVERAKFVASALSFHENGSKKHLFRIHSALTTQFYRICVNL